MKTFALTLLALLCASALALAQGEPKTPTIKPQSTEQSSNVPLGQLRVSGHVYVGEPAPDFELTSSAGRQVSLSRLKGDWVLLSFADDRKAFAGLRELHEGLKELGVVLLGICKDKPQALRPFVQREGITFELVADATGEISAIYGLYDVARSASRPGFVVVDRNGIVRLALQGQAPPKEVLELTRFTIVGF